MSIQERLPQITDPEILFQEVVDGVSRHREKYHWVGIYLLKGKELVLEAYVGEPSPHARIPLEKGICGAAVREKRTLNIPDVADDPRYLACSTRTKSELVVPLMAGEKIYGELDLDSHDPNAFAPEDVAFLEEVATLLSARLQELEWEG